MRKTAKLLAPLWRILCRSGRSSQSEFRTKSHGETTVLGEQAEAGLWEAAQPLLRMLGKGTLHKGALADKDVLSFGTAPKTPGKVPGTESLRGLGHVMAH